ncbi:MAG: ATP-binding protein [Thermodesulfobacteriota bacterium]
MILPWWPVVAVDVIGSLLTLGIAGLCVLRSWRWSREDREDLFREYVVLLSAGFAVFAVSRSVGHLVKQMLLLSDLQLVWKELSAYSGAVNSVAFVVAFGVSLSFHRFQAVNEHLRRQRDRLEDAVAARTAGLAEANLRLAEESRARLAAMQQLADERQRLTVTLRSIGDGVIAVDIKGRIVLLNNAAEQLCGWEEKDAVGRPLDEVLQLVDRRSGQVLANPLAKVLEAGERVELPGAIDLIGRDSTVRSIADSGAPIIDIDGRVVGGVLVFRDVGEKERLEELEVRAQKLESLGVLAGGIAHDFNNILTAISGHVQLARGLLPAGEKAEEMLAAAEQACRRAGALAKQLLTFARGGRPVREIVDLERLVRESAELTLRGTNVRAEFEMEKDLRPVQADGGQIAQVIQNLVLNGRQAMAGGGTLRLTCGNFTGAPPGLAAGEWVRIDVADEGEGIPAGVRTRIFDPYFTTKPQGSGLGLAICHSIVSKHEGVITVLSPPGRGAVFSVYLPAAAGRRSPAAAKPVVETKAARARILLMDDEAMVAEVFRGMLESLGHRVTVVGDGGAAVAAWFREKEEGGGFDWGILDLTVPGMMGGLQAAGEILAKDAAARLVVASGYNNDPVLADPVRYGFVDLIAKPCQIERLEAIFGRAEAEATKPAGGDR